jgi:membrane fusion protein, macrolide-specific efflux system
MKIRLFGIVLLLAVGAGAVFVAIRPTSASGQEGDLLTAAASRRTVTSDAVATGNVAFSAVYGLAFGSGPTIVSTATTSASSSSGSSSSGSGSSSSWTVKKIDAAPGATVKKGAVLATATAADLSAQLSSANDQLKADRNRLTDADDQLDAATTTDGERAARSAIYQARAAITDQQRSIADLKRQLSYATLTAPVDGVVTAVDVVAGLPAGSGVAIEIGAKPLEVVGSYAEADLGSLAVGQPATVTVSAAAASVPGTVVAIAPTASSSGGSSSVVTYDVTVALTNPPTPVKPGMSADVSITTASAADVVAVPSVALNGTAATGYTVGVVAADGSVAQRTVDVGLVTSSWAEIRSGLSEGDRVVTGTSTARQSTGTPTNGGFGVGLPGAGFGGGNRGNGGGNGNRGNGGATVVQP